MKRDIQLCLLALVVFGASPSLAAPPASAPAAAAWSIPQNSTLPKVQFRVHTPASLQQVLRWEVPAEIQQWAAREATMKADAGRTLAMRQNRAEYTLAKPSGFDLLTVDTYIDLDLEVQGVLDVTTEYELTTVDYPVSNFSLILMLEELVSVESSTHQITYQLTGDTIKMKFEPELAMGETAKLTIRSKGEPRDMGDSMLPTVRLKGEIWYVTHSRFMPIKNDSNDVFTGKMVLRVKGPTLEAQGAGGTGTLTSVDYDAVAGVKTFTFTHKDLTSLYAFAVSKFVQITSPSAWNSSVFVQQSYVPYAGLVLGVMDDVLDKYSAWFWPYQWEKLDAVQMPNSFGGGFGPLSTIMCYSGVFSVGEEDGVYDTAQLFSHEIGHQWWGNTVEMADSGSVFLSESMAEFSSNFYFEKTYASRWPFYSNSLTYIYTVKHEVEPALVSPFIYNSPYYYQMAYQKGACVADALRTNLGEETMLAGIKEFMNRYHCNFARVEEFFEVMEEVAGVSLEAFYERWMKGTGPAKLFVATGYNSETSSLRVEIRQEPGTEAEILLPIRVELTDGTLKEFTVLLDGPVVEASFPVPQPIRRVQFDPRRKQIRRLVPLIPGDVDANGIVDGRDLVELSFAYGTDIVYGEGGQNYFIPNANYEELADLAGPDGPGDMDGQINEMDYELFLQKVNP